MKQLTVALAGNPNVGKSTIFNALTGLHQHTGNWPGKTVALAEGSLRVGDCSVHLVDLPGTYSLTAGSPEEAVARDYLLSGAADVTLAVADATCLCRNLNLILQIRQITSRLVVCVNLLDEAEKDGLEIDLAALSRLLACPVVGAAAGRGRGLAELMRAIIAQAEYTAPPGAWRVPYPAPVEKALALLPCPRYRALALLCGELAPQPEETAALYRALDSLGSITGRDL
ncbi:MAG: ferrous iron transporter B, partial [Oscillospiraceae bacterium]|nr:ferrous iron transporter B [Oscillospiraceae bacterium]